MNTEQTISELKGRTNALLLCVIVLSFLCVNLLKRIDKLEEQTNPLTQQTNQSIIKPQ